MRWLQSFAILCGCLVVSNAQAARLTTAPLEPPTARTWTDCGLRAIEAAVARSDQVVPEEFDGSVDDTVLCAGRGLFGRRTANRAVTGRQTAGHSGAQTPTGRASTSNPWNTNQWNVNQWEVNRWQENQWKINRWTHRMSPHDLMLWGW